MYCFQTNMNACFACDVFVHGPSQCENLRGNKKYLLHVELRRGDWELNNYIFEIQGAQWFFSNQFKVCGNKIASTNYCLTLFVDL